MHQTTSNSFDPSKDQAKTGKNVPRVVSLLPSATELLCYIGGQALLVARSHECDFPGGLETLPVLTSARVQSHDPAALDREVSASIGGGNSLYSLDEATLARLNPDVILTQDLCEVCSIDLRTVERVAAGMNPRPTIVSLNPNGVEGVLDDLLRVGAAVGLGTQAQAAMVRLRERLHRAIEFVNPYADPTPVAFLEWTDPLFVAGHWTVQLIERAGGSHALNPTRPGADDGAAAGPQAAQRRAGKSFRISPEQLVESQPEYLVIAPCGLGLEATRHATAELETRAWWRSLPAVRLHTAARPRVWLADGNQMFNRPGPRLAQAQEWLVGLLNDRPDILPPGFPAEAWIPT